MRPAALPAQWVVDRDPKERYNGRVEHHSETRHRRALEGLRIQYLFFALSPEATRVSRCHGSTGGKFVCQREEYVSDTVPTALVVDYHRM